MIFYHVTPAENLDHISRTGLEPRRGPRSEEFGEESSRIYLFPDADALSGALESWLEDAFDPEEPLACLTVDMEGIPYSQDEVEFEVTVCDLIPADRLKLLSRDIWEEYGVPEVSSAQPLQTDDTPEP